MKIYYSMKLKCNNCRKIIENEEEIEIIMKSAEKWRQQWSMDLIRSKHGVSPCNQNGCYGELFKTN